MWRLSLEQRGQLVHRAQRVGVRWAEAFFVQQQRAAEHRLRIAMVALLAQHVRQRHLEMMQPLGSFVAAAALHGADRCWNHAPAAID